MRPIEEFSYLKHNKVPLDSGSLIQLYFPIIGSDALALYEYLLTFFDDGVKRHKFSEVLNHLQFGMRRMEEALVMLTAVDLVVLYRTTDGYLFKLHPALGNEAFLGNPIYRRLLEQKIGGVAVDELALKIPQDARDISKKFSDVFGENEQATPPATPSKVHFDLDSFQRLMTRDGLRFKNDKEDVIEVYSIADKFNLNWFDTYQLAKETAISGQIAPQRMLTRKEQASAAPSQEFDKKEQIIIREAKSDSAKEFLAKIKKTRRAIVTKGEEQLLIDLAKMNFLDEVINVMTLYTLNKTKSANLNKPYIMKVANDFAYQKVTTAEEAVLKMRSFAERKSSKSPKPKRSNVPEWTEKEYKQVATAEEAAKLEELRRSMLED